MQNHEQVCLADQEECRPARPRAGDTPPGGHQGQLPRGQDAQETHHQEGPDQGGGDEQLPRYRGNNIPGREKPHEENGRGPGQSHQRRLLRVI